ncbi:chromate transporter [Clostridium formicaceticum]|uniref:Chromate transport protein n=1 Tax=Clostridium formicaceticum TaxID=1497 RepID=A0AAC9RIQ7_9CLOT|nr:chromate transporter [Clostridium formicaceticum]AOY75941.1 chromate transporter [Clostridium formicaceticum]ARE86289.1 putative chromate transport protein [Clostridium formicaceticum]
MKDYLQLFSIFFRIGAFTFGGGYAMLPIMEKEIVEKHNLIREDEFLDIIAVAQSLPGPIAVNTAVFVGYKVKGFLGAIFTLIGTVLPSLTVIIVLAIFYDKIKHINTIQLFFQGVRPAIVALILMAALKLSKSVSKTNFNIIIMVFSFMGIVLLKIHPIFVIISCAAAGLLHKKKEGKRGTH